MKVHPVNLKSIKLRHGGHAKILTMIFTCIFCCLLLSSCYSVRLKTTNGVGNPDPTNDTDDYYGNLDLEVIEIDTVISISAISKDFTYFIKDCESSGIHIIEYRNTLGGVLLSGITFGKKRRVKVKYVCTKPSN
jgi:hypothetical protein